MKLHISKRYYKNSRKGREPAIYHAKQPKGVGTDIHAIVKLDPILKKHRDLRKGILKHESSEIEAWGKGRTACHRYASSKEPEVTRKLGGVKGFWKEIEKRNRRS